MSQEELLKIAQKVKDNTATKEERSIFFAALNEILKDMSTVLDEAIPKKQ